MTPFTWPQVAVEAANAAYEKACQDWPQVECPQCKGRGYHHGFGEDGHDPDWCNTCGGPGTVADDTYQPMQFALSAAVEAMAKADMARDGVGYITRTDGKMIAYETARDEDTYTEFPVLILKSGPDEKGEA